VEQKEYQSQERNTVIVRDIPLSASEGAIKAALKKFGDIHTIYIRPVEIWQTAIVTFKEEKDAQLLAEMWSIPFEKEYLRILPKWEEKEELVRRSKHVLKLAGLPAGTTAYDLEEIARETGGKTLYIPRTGFRYLRERFAYVAFETEDQLKTAEKHTFKLDRTTVNFVDQYERLCYKCGQSGHIAFQCEEVRIQRDKSIAQAKFASIQSRFRKGPEKEAPISFAEILRKRSRSRSVYKKESSGRDNMSERLSDLETKIRNMENKINTLWKWWMASQQEQKEAEHEIEEEKEQQTQYQDAEEMYIEENEIPLTTYKAINDEVAERQDKLEKQIESMGRMLAEVLENGQAASTKRKQQSQGY
jgi:hypothetical protein